MAGYRGDKVNVYLIGFSGCGKSSVGPLLAAGLKAKFFDTDEIISRQTRRSISQIFADRGEAAFRTLEEKVVRGLVERERRPKVVALGGGAFQNPRIRRLVAADGTSVYLSCSVRELYRRNRDVADRPLLAGMSSHALYKRIKSLIDRRLHNYKEAAVIISTSTRSPRQAAAELRKKLAKLHG